MDARDNRDQIVARLREDALRHIVTLKMLRLYGGAMQTSFAEDDTGWALVTLQPVGVSEFDRRTYPGAELAVMVDGPSPSLKLSLLGRLPRVPLVVKTADEAVAAFAVEAMGGRRVRSFRSFTSPAAGPPAGEGAGGILEGGMLEAGVARLLANNGYSAAELEGHFSDGARWFSVRRDRVDVSAGFVFRNFESVWEIGGLFTLEGHRRRGHARAVVDAALRSLASRGLVPRYQVRSDNLASVRLAEAAGLREFLRVDHILCGAAP